jgi:hypothetical protein
VVQVDQVVEVLIQDYLLLCQDFTQQQLVVGYQVKVIQVPQDFMVLDLQGEKVAEVAEVTVVPHQHLVVKLQLLLLFQILVMVVQVQILVQVIQVYQTQGF